MASCDVKPKYLADANVSIAKIHIADEEMTNQAGMARLIEFPR